MKAKLLTAALSTILATGLPAFAQTATYHIDPAHSEIGFSIRHMAISTVHGRFGIKTGTIVFDPKDVTKSSVEAVIDVSSVDTGTATRDADLKTAQFFDTANFPTATFNSNHVKSTGGG
jgi:polyisoprenoid-binding protein YceI